MQQKPDYSQLMQLARSEAGQQLLTLLQRTGGDSLNQAISKASAGDFIGAKALLSALLQNEDAQKILKQLEDPQ